MKQTLFFAAALATAFAACQSKQPQATWAEQAIDAAACQLKQTADELEHTTLQPRTVHTGHNVAFLKQQLQRADTSYLLTLVPNPTPEQLGQRRTCTTEDWTSGFFPGSLWYAYELTGDEELKKDAVCYTNRLNAVRYQKDTHDVGFVAQCSYGNALRLAPNDTIKTLLLETADNLCARFNPEIGCIRSWDFGTWNFPVIIDNMMNLELLFNASRLSGDSRYRDIAVRHAQTTMKNHFRADYTSYHVVSYNNDGTVEKKQTFQGKNDGSAWARGQAWGVYGYTVCYRETRDTAFLQHAVHIADMIMQRVSTADAIPYWDYDAPAGDSTPRDASAAAVTASALLELCTYLPDGQRYRDYAVTILKSLSSPAYLAKKGTNQGFVLMHSTGSLPHGSEIDVPLNYADYYYLEAMSRYMHGCGSVAK